MTSYRAEIQLFSRNDSGGFVGEGSVTETFEAESDDRAKLEFFQLLPRYRRRNGNLADLCIKATVSTEGHKILDLDECFDLKRVKEAFFAYKKEHPESVPEDQMTPLQKRMQSGGPGVRVDHDPSVEKPPSQ